MKKIKEQIKDAKMIKRIEAIVKKDKKKIEGWVLYSGLYQINWKNNKAIEVEVGGKIFKATKK